MQQVECSCNVRVNLWTDLFSEIEEGVRSSGTFSTEPEIKQEASKRFTLNFFVPDVRSIVKERSGAKEVAAEKDFLVTDQGVMVETDAGLVSAEDLFITRRQKKNLEDVDESETLRAAFTSIISSPTAEVYFPVHNRTEGVDQVRYVSHWKREGNKVKAKMIRIDEGGTDKSMKDAHTIISELVGDGFTETRRSERHYVFSKIQLPAEGVRGSFPAGTDRVEKEGHIAPLPPVEVITPPAEEPIGVKKDISQTPHGEPALMRSQPESNGVRKTVVPHTAHSLVDDVSEMGYQVAEDIHETVVRAARTIREITKQRSVRNDAARGEEVPALSESVVLQGTHLESGNGIVGSRTDTRKNDAIIEPRHVDRNIFSQADRIMLEKTWQDVREKQTVITFAHHTGTGVGAALANIHALSQLRIEPVRVRENGRRVTPHREMQEKLKGAQRIRHRTMGTGKHTQPIDYPRTQGERMLSSEKRRRSEPLEKSKRTMGERKSGKETKAATEQTFTKVGRERLEAKSRKRNSEQAERAQHKEGKTRKIRKMRAARRPMSESPLQWVQMKGRKVERSESKLQRTKKEKKDARIVKTYGAYDERRGRRAKKGRTVRRGIRHRTKETMRSDVRHRDTKFLKKSTVIPKNYERMRPLRRKVVVRGLVKEKLVRAGQRVSGRTEQALKRNGVNRNMKSIDSLNLLAYEYQRLSDRGFQGRDRRDIGNIARVPKNGKQTFMRRESATRENEAIQNEGVRAIVAFRFAFILWHVLSSPLQLHSKNNRMHPEEDILPENTGSPWVLLAVISYLAALREQGIAPMIVYTVPVIQIPRTGTIFLYQSWYDENTYG